MKESIRKERITPRKAKKILSKVNNGNRNISNYYVDSYAVDMKNHKWSLNNQLIAFDVDGNLVDGQHRLMAVIRSGVPITTYVMYGLDRNSVIETIDKGRPRSIAHTLQMVDHMKYTSEITSACRTIVALACGQTRSTTALIRHVYDLYEKEINLVVTNMESAKRLKLGSVLAAMVIGAKVDSEKTIEFEQQYFSGEGLTKTDPAYRFREYMLRLSGEMGTQTRRFKAPLICLSMIKRHINNEPVKYIRYDSKIFDWFAAKQWTNIKSIIEFVSLAK